MSLPSEQMIKVYQQTKFRWHFSIHFSIPGAE